MSELNLHQRIIAIMETMGAVGKSGKTTYGQSYEYHKIDDVDDRLRKTLISNGVVATINEIADRKLEHFEEIDKGGKPRTTWYAECSVFIKLVNADDPEQTLMIQGWGQGLDYSDKATGKAISYAAKSAYLSAFHLRGQPDSEKDNITRKQPPGKRKKTYSPLPVDKITELDQALQSATTANQISIILRGDDYDQLKFGGPNDVYLRLKAFAKSKHTLLTTEGTE